jgi:hypothetical protein
MPSSTNTTTATRELLRHLNTGPHQGITSPLAPPKAPNGRSFEPYCRFRAIPMSRDTYYPRQESNVRPRDYQKGYRDGA